MSTNSFTIGQSSKKRIDKDYYDWSIWIEEEETILRSIESVTYYLHETFPTPIREISNAKTKFKLKTAGWGTFEIRLSIKLIDGQIINQNHYLILEENYNSANTIKSKISSNEFLKGIKIFISFSSMDRSFARKIQQY